MVMGIVRRILITLVVTLAVVFTGMYWIVPVAMSFYSASKANPVTRVLPVDLRDVSVSQAGGTKLSYLGYDFEVPWSDLDESKTEVFPKDKPNKTVARFHFRSGLQLVVFAVPPHFFYDQYTKEIKMEPTGFASAFGSQATTSDYEFVKRVFEFSPDEIPHWTTTPRIQSRVTALLLTKSIIPTKFAQTGIFNLHNAAYKGFQQGNPNDQRTSKDGLLLSLYSDDGGVEIMISERDYKASCVTQPEINRIVQSFHRTEPRAIAASANQ
jgi:hypothetical protein